MQKTVTHLAIIASTIIASAILIFNIQSPSEHSVEKESESSISKEQSFKEAMEHEYNRTHDPKLNRIPSERLLDAQAYYAAQEKTKGKTSTPLSNIQWAERGPNNVGGRTRAVLFLSATKVLAAGVTGGLWKTDDITAGSPSWSPIGDFLSNSINVSCIAQDPNTFGTLYMGTGEAFGSSFRGSGIYKSTDTGTTWSFLSSTSAASSNDFSYVARLLVAQDGNVYAACKSAIYCNAGGLLKSTNGGTSWNRVVGTLTGVTCAGAADYIGADLGENAAGDLFYSSGDGNYDGHVFISNISTHGTSVGNSGNWSDITPTGTWERIEMGVSKQSGSGVIYVVCEGSGSNDVTGIYYSSNKGSSWTSRTVPTICDQGNNSVYTRGQAFYDLVVQIDPGNDSTFYIGGIDMLKSTNYGASFTQNTTWSGYWTAGGCAGSIPPIIHADQHGLFFNPFTSNAALASNDGGLYYSTNMTTAIPTWATKNSGFNVTQYYGIATHPSDADYVIGGTQDNGSHKLTSSGVVVGTSVSGGDGAFCHIHQTSPTYQTTQYVYNSFYLSSNAGSSFVSQTSSNAGTGRFINPSDMDDANNRIFSAGNANYLEMRTGLNSGSLTRTTHNLVFGGRQLTALAVSPNNTTNLYVGDNNGTVYKITARGTTTPVKSATWTVGAADTYVSSIDVWESTSGDDDSILVTMSSYGSNSVYYTANGTAGSPTWTDIDDNSTLQDMPVRWGIFSKESSGKIFIASDLGVLATESITGGTTAWTMVNNSLLPSVRVDMLAYDSEGNLVAGTHGRGIWETKNPCNLSASIPTNAGTYTSTNTGTDGTSTCYCDTDGKLLLALDLTGSGAVIPKDSVSLQIGATATTSWNSSGGIITNSGGGAIINRKWNVAPSTQPTSTVKVKHFFTNAEYSAIVSALGALTSPTTVTAPSQLQFYKLTNGGVFADPHGSSITGIVFGHSGTPSTSSWTYASFGSTHSAEYLVSSFSGGGGGGGGGGGASLPVELSWFEATAKPLHTAILTWETSSETNNDYFDVERSFDGLSFQKIGQVKGIGTSTKVNKYSYLDVTIPRSQTTAFYRLKQTDFDGKYECSTIRKVRLDADLSTVSVYPIPARNVLHIDAKENIDNVRIFDMSGKSMAVKFNLNRVDISNLGSGAYFIIITIEGIETRRKFIVE
jgi:hypothetical protein